MACNYFIDTYLIINISGINLLFKKTFLGLIMFFYETFEKMPTFVKSYPALAGFSSAQCCKQTKQV